MKLLINKKIPNVLLNSIIFLSGSSSDYVFSCTCKKTNPNANPNKVIPQQIAIVVKISPIFSFIN